MELKIKLLRWTLQKIQKLNWNVKVQKAIEIPLPRLKFKKNCPWELKSIRTLLIFILESWDLKTCECVFDVKTCKQKVAQGTNFCCPFCLSAAIDLQLEKMFQNQTWPVKSMSNQTHQIWTKPYKNDVPNQYLKLFLKSINNSFFFSETVIFNSFWKNQ